MLSTGSALSERQGSAKHVHLKVKLKLGCSSALSLGLRFYSDSRGIAKRVSSFESNQLIRLPRSTLLYQAEPDHLHSSRSTQWSEWRSQLSCLAPWLPR